MWITTSRHSPVGLRGIARKIALAIPGAEYKGRGERPLSRIDRLAIASGVATTLVLGKGKGGKLFIMARHNFEGQGAQAGTWHQSRMDEIEILFLSEAKESKARYEFGGKMEKQVRDFFGVAGEGNICNGTKKAKFECKKGMLGIIVGRKKTLEMKYKWVGLDG